MINNSSPEYISARVLDDLGYQGWSFLSTDIDPADRSDIHELFQVMNRTLAFDSTIQPETTTLAPRDHSRVLATTREAMSYHTDNVYLDNPCRTVALFCTVQAEEGGGNTLVDGIEAVRTLPEEMISELKLTQWRWMNPATNTPSGEYAVIDESEERMRWWRMSLLSQKMAQVAVADAFEAALDGSPTKRRVLMQPGDILVTDNSRIVHNREAFSGARHLYRARFW